MQQMARGWLAAELTDDRALALGVLPSRGVPQLVFSLVGGAVADRLEKRRILIVAQMGMGLLALLNAVLVHTGVVQVWHLFVLGLFQGRVPLFLYSFWRSLCVPRHFVGWKHGQPWRARNHAP